VLTGTPPHPDPTEREEDRHKLARAVFQGKGENYGSVTVRGKRIN